MKEVDAWLGACVPNVGAAAFWVGLTSRFKIDLVDCNGMK